MRPGWDGNNVSSLDELITLLSAPPALALLILTAIAVRYRSQGMGLAVVVLWTILASLMTSMDPTGLRDLARIEGCVGSPTLFLGVVTAICAATILYTAPLKKRDNERSD